MQLRMLLNTGFSGPQAWLLLAIHRGHVAAAGIELVLTTGAGAYTAAPRMAEGGYDLGYGDINALVEVAARRADAPVGVYASFNASPACIALPPGAPGLLAGARLIGNASDVALRCFPTLCAATGLDPASVTVTPAEGAMADLADRVLAGEADGLFAYVSTLTAALAARGRAAGAEFRLLRYDAVLPDLHGSAVMASRRLVAEHPEALRRLVAAFDRGMAEALAEPEAAMDAVLAFAPAADRAVERLRWETTLAVEMAHPSGLLGAVDPARFARGVALHAAALGLPPPDPAALFTPAFLPPEASRARRWA